MSIAKGGDVTAGRTKRDDRRHRLFAPKSRRFRHVFARVGARDDSDEDGRQQNPTARHQSGSGRAHDRDALLSAVQQLGIDARDKSPFVVHQTNLPTTVSTAAARSRDILP